MSLTDGEREGHAKRLRGDDEDLDPMLHASQQALVAAILVAIGASLVVKIDGLGMR